MNFRILFHHFKRKTYTLRKPIFSFPLKKFTTQTYIKNQKKTSYSKFSRIFKYTMISAFGATFIVYMPILYLKYGKFGYFYLLLTLLFVNLSNTEKMEKIFENKDRNLFNEILKIFSIRFKKIKIDSETSNNTITVEYEDKIPSALNVHYNKEYKNNQIKVKFLDSDSNLLYEPIILSPNNKYSKEIEKSNFYLIKKPKNFDNEKPLYSIEFELDPDVQILDSEFFDDNFKDINNLGNFLSEKSVCMQILTHVTTKDKLLNSIANNNEKIIDTIINLYMNNPMPEIIVIGNRILGDLAKNASFQKTCKEKNILSKLIKQSLSKNQMISSSAVIPIATLINSMEKKDFNRMDKKNRNRCVRALLLLSQHMISLELFSDAIIGLENALKINSDDINVCGLLAAAYEGRGNTEKANEQLRKLVKLIPIASDIRYNLAMNLYKKGPKTDQKQKNEAEKQLIKAIKLDNSSQPELLYLLLSKILNDQKRYYDSIYYLNSFLKNGSYGIAGTKKVTIALIETYLKNGKKENYQEIIKLIKNSKKNKKKFFTKMDYYNSLANFKLKNNNESLKSVNEFIKNNQKDQNALSLKLKLEFLNKNWEEVISCYNKMSEKKDKKFSEMISVAKANESIGKIEMAKKYYHELSEKLLKDCQQSKNKYELMNNESFIKVLKLINMKKNISRDVYDNVEEIYRNLKIQ